MPNREGPVLAALDALAASAGGAPDGDVVELLRHR